MTVLWSKVLHRDVDGNGLKAEYIETNKQFWAYNEKKDIHKCQHLDERCTKLFDEFADWLSREGVDAEPFLDFKDQADRTAEERERALAALVHADHEAHKAHRDLTLTSNGYIAAHESEHHPHVIDSTAKPSPLLQKE